MATKLYSVFKPHHQYFMKNCINTVSSFTKMNSVMCSTIEQKDHFPKSPTKSRIFEKEKCQTFLKKKNQRIICHPLQWFLCAIFFLFLVAKYMYMLFYLYSRLNLRTKSAFFQNYFSICIPVWFYLYFRYPSPLHPWDSHGLFYCQGNFISFFGMFQVCRISMCRFS